MRKITLEPLNNRKWTQWTSDCDTATRDCLHAVEQNEQPILDEGLYKRKSIKQGFFFSKGPPFYGKCAYCECYIIDFQHGDIDHFRPKGGVTDEQDQPILLRDSHANL